MIRITVDLIPLGIESLKKKIGECQIINDSTGTKEIGNYIIELKDKNHQHTCKVKNFKRLEKNVWELLQIGLNKIYKKGN